MRTSVSLALLSLSLLSLPACLPNTRSVFPVERANLRPLPTLPPPPARDRRFDATAGMTFGSIIDAALGDPHEPTAHSLPDVQLDLSASVRLSRFASVRILADFAPPLGANELGGTGFEPPSTWTSRLALGGVTGYWSEDERFSFHVEVDLGAVYVPVRGVDHVFERECDDDPRMPCGEWMDRGLVSWEDHVLRPFVRGTVTLAYWAAPWARPYVSGGVQTRPPVDLFGDTAIGEVVGIVGAGLELRVADLSMLLTVSWPFGERGVDYGPLFGLAFRGAAGDGFGSAEAWARIDERREARRLRRTSNTPVEETLAE